MKDLKGLLDFGTVKTKEAIEMHFYHIAQELFYNFELKCLNGEHLRITEVELYIRHNQGFEDRAMHNPHHAQITSGKFHLHRHPKSPAHFKKPSHIGLDITCGNRFSCYAGLLIRQTRKGDEFFSCSKTVLQIIGGACDGAHRERTWKENEIFRLNELDEKDIFNKDIGLIQTAADTKLSVWSSSRKIEEDKNHVDFHIHKLNLRAVSSLSSQSKKNLKEVKFKPSIMKAA